MEIEKSMAESRQSVGTGELCENEPKSDEKSVNQISFCDLACGKKVVLIEHHGAQYRLLETRNGKLILNK